MTSLLLLSILLVTPNLSSSAKNQNAGLASPVYEVVNEQARIDDRIRISSNPGLPYGNPLAGKQNARLHFNNQQAMFNAERMRQLTAQLQRQSRGPKLIDSYMQAYHESQDNHQLALEQQQTNLQEERTAQRGGHNRPNPYRETKERDEYLRDYPRKNENTQIYGLKTRTETRKTQRAEPIRESARKSQRTEVTEPSRRTRPELMRITKADAKEVRYRNYRSYGSLDYYQHHLEPQRYKTVYLSPGPTYDQGVTIKPNGNLGVSQESKTKLLTEAIPSGLKYIYPKQYHQMQDYKSIQEIQENNQLENQKLPEYSLSDTNDAPLDYYFYLKDPTHSLPQSYDQYRYAQLANTYASAYTTPLPTTDYKPITEDVDDIEDPNAHNPQAFTPLPTQLPTVPTKALPIQPTPTVNYKPEELNHIYSFDEGLKQEEAPIAQAVHFYQPYYNDKEEKKYLHTNVESTGVQHLTEEGTVSAYGNDNVSKNTTSRNKRSNLDTELFSTGESTDETPDDIPDKTPDEFQDKSTSEPSELPTPEPLIRLKKIRNHRHRTSPIVDSDDDELYIPVRVKNHELEASFEEDYGDYDDTDYSTTNIKPVINVDTTYVTPKIQRGPVLYSPPATSYGYPINYPIQKLPSNVHMLNSLSSLHDVLEPVYMITESQLKELMGRNLNIEHLDVYQLSKPNKVKIPAHFPRRYKKRNSQRYRNYKIKNKLHKLGKLLN